MPNRRAVANGNWSNTATWDGGTLPTSSDNVYANGFTIAIDQNITVNKISTAASSPAIAGGGFTLASNINRTLTCNIEAGTTICLTINEGTGTIDIIGNINGGTSTNASGVYLNATNTTNNHKRPSIYGNLLGGTATGTHALSGRSDRGFDPTIYGNVFAGTAGGGISFSTTQISNVTIYGNITANGAVGSSSGGNLYLYGTSTASNNNYGSLATLAYISGIIYNSAGYWGVYSSRIFVSVNQAIEMRLNEQTTGNNVFLYSANSFVGIPSSSDVRNGIVYGPSNDLTGTLNVPSASSVAVGVPVDNTTGTAMISITDMGALLASYIV